MTQVFVASRNAKKIAEMERILGPLVPGVRVLGLDDVEFYGEPVEDGATFEDNALIKARAGYAATGLPSVADDSGLCVDALNGMPGVLSARWSGKPKSDERNNRLLLEQLEDVPDVRRGAHFACAIAFVHAGVDGTEQSIVVEGRMDGHVIRELRGSGGFGYDVLFVAEDTAAAEGDAARTSAELSVAEKDAISHRGKAMREIGPRIAAVLAD
jgi:XTP/dITP diphosphohydrolase